MKRDYLIIVQEERAHDIEAIRRVHQAAFPQPQESQLVDAIRDNGGVLLSLVAIVDERVVGHILYSLARIGEEANSIKGAGLGPMAVLPDHQREGIGTALITTGNQMIQRRGYPFIIVLGHPEYYSRFGFEPASRHGIRCDWDVPDDVFMVQIVDDQRMKGVSGLAKYCQEFYSVL